MRNANPIFARAVVFARRASDTSLSDAERATSTDKLASYCTEHNVSIADAIAAAAMPEPVKRQPLTDTQAAAVADAVAKRAPKPVAKPAKPAPAAAKPTKPAAADASRSADYDKRVALIAELRASVAGLYNGPSLAIRSNPKRIAGAVYADLLASPKHRTELAKLTARDESALREIISRGTKAGAFDPSEINLDSGIFSRLASVGFLASNDSAASPFKLTAAGLAHARNVIKRAA